MQCDHSVIVIGNGESRISLDIRSYWDKINLIGCNAIHRDMKVNHLVCCDHRMVREAVNNKKVSTIYTRPRYYKDFYKVLQKEKVKNLPDLPYEGSLKPDQPEHWGSGPYAVLLAANLNFKDILIVGFDLYGKNNLVNNVYKGSQNYLPENKSAVDPSYWIYQMRKVFLHYSDKTFTIFNYDNWQCPEDWRLPNVRVFELDKFYTEVAKAINTVYN
jgi:hypothetical protein